MDLDDLIDLTSDDGIEASTSPRRPKRRAAAPISLAESDDESDDDLGLWERISKKTSAAKNKEETTKPKSKSRKTVVSSDEEEFSFDDEEENIPPKKSKNASFSSSSISSNEFEKSTKDLFIKKKTITSSIGQKASKKTLGEPSSKEISSYLKNRSNGVKARNFDLSKIVPQETIATGRTIKRTSAWNGLWPALREFLQNTIDHLQLLDHKTGRRNSALKLEISEDENDMGGKVTSFQFLCGQEIICSISALGDDELIIEQAYTFPLPPRALDTGVPDTSKQKGSTAGGFGDGFKTAAVCLLSLGTKGGFKKLDWIFESQGQRVIWDFVGRRREAVGTYAACSVLEVDISKEPITQTNSSTKNKICEDNWMKQHISCKGIGMAFLMEAVPKLQVFWDMGDESFEILELPPFSTGGGDYICEAKSLPTILGSASSSSSSSRSKKAKSFHEVRPQEGVYVRGIYVRKSKIEGTIMSFFGPRLEVSGRDRNDVDEDELVGAVAHVLLNCQNQPCLQKLLQPLLGQKQGVKKGASSSWLLRSPRFFNILLECYKDMFLYDILGYKHGTVFVSSKTTNSKDPLISWAATYLNNSSSSSSHGSSGLVPIEPGANKYLFEEVSLSELIEKCVRILLEEDRTNHSSSKSNNKNNSQSVSKMLNFMIPSGGRGKSNAVKVIFAPSVTQAFAHDKYLFIPTAPLTRDLLIRVLNACLSRMADIQGENFTALVQAIFEVTSGSNSTSEELTSTQVDAALQRAKQVRTDNKTFIGKPTSKNDDENLNQPSKTNIDSNLPQSTSSSLSSRLGTRLNAMVVHDDDDDVSLLSSSSSSPSSSSSSNSSSSSSSSSHRSQLTGDSTKHLLKQISETNKRRAGNGKHGFGSIIPPTSFAEDGAGNENCLRASSTLTAVKVSQDLGGGELLCDTKTANELKNTTTPHALWPASRRRRIAALRSLLSDAVNTLGTAIPSAKVLLERVVAGIDCPNTTYEAFCDGEILFINLASYLPKFPASCLEASGGNFNTPSILPHDLLSTVAHELAHLMDGTGGHGQQWRDIHMSLLNEVYAKVMTNSSLSQPQTTSAYPGAWALLPRCSCQVSTERK